MAQMGIAGCATYFGARVSELVVDVRDDGVAGRRIVEAGPATSGIELRGRAEELGPAGPAGTR